MKLVFVLFCNKLCLSCGGFGVEHRKLYSLIESLFVIMSLIVGLFTALGKGIVYLRITLMVEILIEKIPHNFSLLFALNCSYKFMNVVNFLSIIL